MTSPVRNGDLLTAEEVIGEFFAPAATDMISSLVAQYQQGRQRIANVAAYAQGEVFKSVLGYFLTGNATEDRGRVQLSSMAAQLFQEPGAVAQLNAEYWQKALDLTDVYNAMPQDRRSQWNEQIRNPAGVKKNRGGSGEWETPPLPDFEEKTVRATLAGLLNNRAKFLAERVDGIFRALSGEHVTNSPAAFGKRMILAHVVSSWGTSTDRVGYINDLRCVIAKFMGRDEPRWNSSASVLARARREHRGKWVTLDGGALRLRAYQCGTAHLEVHPDMAWRLNCILAHLYPQAIPPEFREKPKKKPKDFVMMGRPLPFAVLNVLEEMEAAYALIENTGPDAWRNRYRRVEISNAMQFKYGTDQNTRAREEAARALAYIGGVMTKKDSGGEYFAFDYDPREVIQEIIFSGCLPDQKAHQYYPTPPSVAQAAVELAMVGATDAMRWLEPSAGTGGLADFMPKDQTTCVEISPLHCKVLKAKGFNTREADFLACDGISFDRIVMNPPFSEGRWQAHLKHAATMLKPEGRLVAILPASAKGKDVLPGFTCEWSRVLENEFAGTSVDVVILTGQFL